VIVDRTLVQAKHRGLDREVKAAWAGLLFTLPVTAGFILLTVGPLLISLYLSFTDYNMIVKPNFIGFQNYADLFSGVDQLFWKSLRVTGYYVFVGTPVYLIVSLGIAMLLNKKFWGRNCARTVLYLPAVIPVISVAMIWKWLTEPSLGVLNNMLRPLGINMRIPWFYSEATSIPTFILLWVWSCGTTFIVFLAGLQNVPDQLYEAMDIDGGRSWHKFWYITIPMITPSILFCSMVSFITAIQCFVPAYSITNGGPNNSTMLYFFYMYREAFRFMRMGPASAIAWVLFIILLIFTQLFAKTTKYWVYYGGE
jgi:multiple sugar transport system permease protein